MKTANYITVTLAASLMALAATPSLAQTNVATGTNVGGNTIQYDLNFGGNDNTAAGGNWTTIGLTDSSGNYVAQLTATSSPEVISLGGDYTLTIAGTFGFWLGADSATDPVDKSAWFYTTGDNGGVATPTDPTFAVGGLSSGDTVSIWGTFGWDTAGKAPVVSFNGAPSVDLNTATANIGTNPGTGDLVSIASGVVASGSSLSGVLGFPSSGNGEGQIGALIIQVTPAAIPEPNAFALIGGGLALCSVMTRRRR